MSATPLTPTAGHRYLPSGVRQYYWVDTIADISAPIRSELDAGTDLTAELADMGGFTVSSKPVDAPDLASRFTSKVPGMIEADDSSLNIYLSKEGGSDVRTLLPRDTEGYIVVFPEGDDSSSGSKTLDVFPVTVSEQSLQPDFDKPGVVVIGFTVTAEPKQNIVIPATV
ncbi:MAG: hypothetical protein ACRDMV_13220 [Streptosporangiales bacterium]